METARKAAAVIIGIVIIILVILAARWTGEKIRERFFTPKQIVTENVLPVQVPETIISETIIATPSATAIPKTGPVEIFYLFSGVAVISGLILRKISSS